MAASKAGDRPMAVAVTYHKTERRDNPERFGGRDMGDGSSRRLNPSRRKCTSAHLTVLP